MDNQELSEPVENSTDSTEQTPKDPLTGLYYSKLSIEIGSHPKSKEIDSLIKNRIELKLTYKQLADKLKEEFGLDMKPNTLRNYYLRKFNPEGKVFNYILDEQEKNMNLLDMFHEVREDLNIERSRNKMLFVQESTLGMPFPDSWRRSNPITTFRRDVLQLGSAVGFFPQMQVGPTIQINNIQQNVSNTKNMRIMQVLDAIFPTDRNDDTEAVPSQDN